MVKATARPDVAVAVNSTVENIGARRLQTVMERVLDEISFEAPEKKGQGFTVDADYVRKMLSEIAIADPGAWHDNAPPIVTLETL